MDPLTCLGASLLSAGVTNREQADVSLCSKLTEDYVRCGGRIPKVRREVCKDF